MASNAARMAAAHYGRHRIFSSYLAEGILEGRHDDNDLVKAFDEFESDIRTAVRLQCAALVRHLAADAYQGDLAAAILNAPFPAHTEEPDSDEIELLYREERQQHAIAALEHALDDARSGDLTGFAFTAIGRPGANQVAMAYSFDETDPAILHEMVDATRTLLVEVARGGQ